LPLQIAAVLGYNDSSGKDKKWARQPIFFCFFGMAAGITTRGERELA